MDKDEIPPEELSDVEYQTQRKYGWDYFFKKNPNININYLIHLERLWVELKNKSDKKTKKTQDLNLMLYAIRASNMGQHAPQITERLYQLIEDKINYKGMSPYQNMVESRHIIDVYDDLKPEYKKEDLIKKLAELTGRTEIAIEEVIKKRKKWSKQ